MKTKKFFSLLTSLIFFIFLGGLLALAFGNNSYTLRIFERNFYQIFSFFNCTPMRADFINPLYNPLKDIFQYLLYRVFADCPLLLSVCWGMISGGALFIMYQSFMLLFKRDKEFLSAAALLVFISMLSVQNQIAAISSQSLVLICFFSAFFVLKNFKENKYLLCAGGLLAGCAAGLEILVLPFCAILLILTKNNAKKTILFLLCAAAGFCITFLPWMLVLFRNNAGLFVVEDIKDTFFVIAAAAGAPLFIFLFTLLPQKLFQPLMAATLAFLIFSTPPLYMRRNPAAELYYKLDFPFTIAEHSTVIMADKRYSFIFPATGIKNITFTAPQEAALKEGQTTYFISDSWTAPFLDGRKTDSFIPSLKASAALKNCEYIIPSSSLKQNVYPVICRVKSIK